MSQTLAIAPQQRAGAMPDKLKLRLYPVVLELFAENDFHQVNIRDICRLSGVSASTIYRYHASKEALLFAILDEHLSAITGLVREHVQGLESSREIFRKIFWVTMDYYDRHPGLAVTAFITVPMRAWMREAAYVRQEAYELVKQVVMRGRHRGELDPALSPAQVVDLYYMHCHRHIHMWYFRGRQAALADTMDSFFEVLWKTVAK